MARRKKELSSGGGLIFGLIWTAFSSLFFFFGAKMVYDGVNRAGWPEVPCSITSFKIKDAPDKDPPFQPVVRYTYQWQEQSHVGDKVWVNKKGEDDYEDLAELNEQYRKGELTHCYVNPDSPDEAALIASSSDIWGGLIFALVGGSFVAIGIGIVVSSRRKKRQKMASISSKKSSNAAPKAIMIPFFAVFAIAGLGILFFVILPKGMKYKDAQGWIETPAKVVWSRVRSHSSDDGTTYSVDIFYRYEFEGNEYRSNTSDLFSGSSSGRSSKQKKVREHPRGKEITCYVNPAQPWQALLERDLGWSSLFALFPLPFIAVGLGGLWWTFRNRDAVRKSNRDGSHGSYGLRQNTHSLRHSAASADPYHSGSHRSIVGDHGKKTFSPGGKRVKSLLGSLLVALFWNGITSVFVTIAVKSWLSGHPEWFLTLFMIPFVLIGLAMIGYTFYQFLTLFNPAPELTLESSGITLNQVTKLKWVISSGSLRLTRFRLYLVGEESAEYRRGTNTVKDTQIFHEQLLFETSSPRKAAKGSVSIMLPANTMTSWASSHNSIQWKLVVKGDISLWPDINDRYVIDVLAPDFNSHPQS